jgi:hypothetical protein
MYSVPIAIALAGLFHFLLADYFKTAKEEAASIIFPLIIFWIGIAFILILDAVYAVHVIAQNTTNPDLTTATRVAYIIVLTSGGLSALYGIIQWIRNSIQLGYDTGTRWRR